MASGTHGQAWEDWGEVDPLFAILTEPKYRHGGGDVNEFLQGGQGAVRDLLQQTDHWQIGISRDSALDFGCGVGRLTGGLADHFRRVVGVDVAPSMLDTARTLHARRDNCEFALNEANDLRWIPDTSFDFVLCLLGSSTPGFNRVHRDVLAGVRQGPQTRRRDRLTTSVERSRTQHPVAELENPSWPADSYREASSTGWCPGQAALPSIRLGPSDDPSRAPRREDAKGSGGCRGTDRSRHAGCDGLGRHDRQDLLRYSLTTMTMGRP